VTSFGLCGVVRVNGRQNFRLLAVTSFPQFANGGFLGGASVRDTFAGQALNAGLFRLCIRLHTL